MITGRLRKQVDDLWNEFWTGGVANPLSVIEQITYLIYLRRLDERELLGERVARRTAPGTPFHDRFAADEQDLRWHRFKGLDGSLLLPHVRDKVFAHLRRTGGPYMKDANLLVAKPSLLASAVSMVDRLPLSGGDTKGDLYEYMLSKLGQTAGVNGQFRTPRQIIKMVVGLCLGDAAGREELTWRVCDPACGTGGFLVGVMEHLMEKYTSPEGRLVEGANGETQTTYTGDRLAPAERRHLSADMLHGFDFDVTMLRIAGMNLALHGADPDRLGVHYQDALSGSFSERFPALAADAFDLVLANPPFKGSLDAGDVHPALARVVKTRKTELLFVALLLRLLRLGGRCGVIVPAGVLEATTAPHLAIREYLVNENQVEAVISLPHFTFKPYASVATAVVIFRKGGRTGKVWGYVVEADGFSDDGVRRPIARDDLPDVTAQWQVRNSPAYRAVPGKHGWFDRNQIATAGFNLLPRTYLALNPHNDRYQDVRLGDLCALEKGRVGAAKAIPGGYPFVTTAAELSTHDTYDFEGPAVCVPLVSSTGHGHASIKRLWYVDGKFAAATIVGVLRVRDENQLLPKYLYYYLQRFKDLLLVPLMRGAANVSLSLAKLATVPVPRPPLDVQRRLIDRMERAEARIGQLEDELRSRRAELEIAMNEFGRHFLA